LVSIKILLQLEIIIQTEKEFSMAMPTLKRFAVNGFRRLSTT
jgi:hypothetical protein